MNLYQEILLQILEQRATEFRPLDFPFCAQKLIEMESYQALQKIKNILEDDSLDDPECFLKIEGIVRIFEELGSNGGSRHDF